jgi:glycosyltransferase involved in cell wall biosynthesis
MLIILTTHPIQYQVPLWQALARDGRIPFEVWFLTDHGTRVSHDPQFGRSFAWDIDMRSGYQHRFLASATGMSPSSFWECRLPAHFRERLRESGANALWIQGWHVLAYWQAARIAKELGIAVWLRGESNDRRHDSVLRRAAKALALGWLFSKVDAFLCIGSANRRLYRRHGIEESRLRWAPYAVDTDRFARAAAQLRPERAELRRRWAIPEGAFVILFCGKFIAKKRPMDLVLACEASSPPAEEFHLLFVGSGELGSALREACDVVYDAEGQATRPVPGKHRPRASFAGFLNQQEIPKAYVAADCLALPSDAGETWGLVVNEAMASGLPCVASDACGCSEDLVAPGRQIRSFEMGNIEALRKAILDVHSFGADACRKARLNEFSLETTVRAVVDLYHCKAPTTGH